MKKNRMKSILLAAVVAVAALGGCGNSDGSSGDSQKKDKAEPEEKVWLDEAAKQYNSEPVRGNKTTWTSIYEDGTESDEGGSVDTFDSEKKIYMTKVNGEADGSGYSFVDYYTEEDGAYYRYIEGQTWDEETGEERTVPLKIKDTAEEPMYLQSTEAVDYKFESDDEGEITELKLTNDGEEKVNDVDTIKLKITFKSQMKKQDLTTREEILKEFDFTEEDISLIDGASEALDAYVEEANANQKAASEKVTDRTVYVWISKEDHKLVQEQMETKAEDDATYEAEEAFYKLSNDIYMVKANIEAGCSKEEALSILAEQPDMEEPEARPMPVSTRIVTTYVTGDACEPVGEPPADAKEVTMEQYENGEY